MPPVVRISSLLARRALAARPTLRGRALCSKVKSKDDGPDEETVRRLAQQSRDAERMWNWLVPERNIDWRGVVGLMALIAVLHTYNSYNRQEEVIVDSLPEGAVEHLPSGAYLMKDGSIRAIDHTPAKVAVTQAPKESSMLLDKIFAWSSKPN